jgi:hypothetical protein
MGKGDAVLKQFTAEVVAEWCRATALYPAFHSLHEAYAVMLEELDEFWEEVRKKPCDRDPDAIYKELVQIAAMALRTVTSLGDTEQRYGL